MAQLNATDKCEHICCIRCGFFFLSMLRVLGGENVRVLAPLCTTARRDKQPRVFRRARTACHQESVQQRSQRAPQQYERRHGDVQRV